MKREEMPRGKTGVRHYSRHCDDCYKRLEKIRGKKGEWRRTVAEAKAYQGL